MSFDNNDSDDNSNIFYNSSNRDFNNNFDNNK